MKFLTPDDFIVDEKTSIIDLSQEKNKTLISESCQMELCSQDRTEIENLYNSPAAKIIKNSIEHSFLKYCIIKDKKVEGLFGLSSHNNANYPWFLSSGNIKKELAYATNKGIINKFILEMKSYNKPLTNFIPESNLRTIMWLRHIGFKFDNENPIVRNHIKYIIFYMM